MSTTRTVVWQRIDNVGLEHLTLTEHDSGMHIDSVVIGMENNTPFRLHYYITSGADYKEKSAILVRKGSSG
ncbi:MAG: putative glycolipid-binding domain-containing protein [Chloroflexi bacterium]|nr:putative glycolipid-binding domain-containing protein [Chloroflexota bacterium]MCC6894519.1 putative glycolipid-binding domain-containing protein [Anaerolineae bacterium]